MGLLINLFYLLLADFHWLLLSDTSLELNESGIVGPSTFSSVHPFGIHSLWFQTNEHRIIVILFFFRTRLNSKFPHRCSRCYRDRFDHVCSKIYWKVFSVWINIFKKSPRKAIKLYKILKKNQKSQRTNFISLV